jgi:hypothetical protein
VRVRVQVVSKAAEAGTRPGLLFDRESPRADLNRLRPDIALAKQVQHLHDQIKSTQDLSYYPQAALLHWQSLRSSCTDLQP